MRKILIPIVVLLALAIAPQALAATVNVSITKAGFVPDPVNIKVGDTVTWTNADTVNRQVVSTQCGFSSPVLTPGQSYSRTFTTAGKCAYVDPLVKPQDKGTVNVAAAPAGVSLTAAPTLVVYGNATTLSGNVSSGASGEKVAVQVQACGQSAFTKVADVTTTTGGAWSYAVKPTMNTTYRVQWKSSTSAPVAVKVRPRLALRKLAARKFSIRVLAGSSFAGKIATLQRRNPTTGAWVKVKLVTLRSLGTATLPINPTAVSGATFRSTVAAKTRIRVILPQAQVGGCYAPGISNAILA